jgi:atrial natriuretic peptide receptor A
MCVTSGCSLALDVAARMAASWNLAVITHVGTASNLGNKADFPTLTRLAYNMEKWSVFYLDVFSFFNWTDIGITEYNRV